MSAIEPHRPPSPPWHVTIEVSADPGATIDFAAIPRRPGVFVFENETGETLAIARTADLRRMIRDRLSLADDNAGPTRRIDYRRLVRRVRALTVGSAFEADWAYLQHARQRTPDNARLFVERFQPWFVHCNPQAAHPRWTKTVHPGRPPAGAAGVYAGPISSKHAAKRYIEMLEDAFDLCRYHHILVQTPHGNACAYKDMGKCPAPCDGTISMDAYKQQIHDSITFATTPIHNWRNHIQTQMNDASELMDFERAARCRRLLDATNFATRRDCVHAGDLNDFMFLAVMPSEKRNHARIFFIHGGWIAPLVDILFDIDDAGLDEVFQTMNHVVQNMPTAMDETMFENIAVISRHLFDHKRPRRQGTFLSWRDVTDHQPVRKALRAMLQGSTAGRDQPVVNDEWTEQQASAEPPHASTSHDRNRDNQ